MGISRKLRTLFRGDIPLRLLPLEFARRRRAAATRAAERASLDELNALPARLLPEFAKLSAEELLEHFRGRSSPTYELPLGDAVTALQEANGIVEGSTWDLMGFGPRRFEGEGFWRRDPVGGFDWGTEYHADVVLRREGGDIRVLWELNRLGHVVTLAAAYREGRDERYARTFFSHIESWVEQNPYARGGNWTCAMEAALRACNVLAALEIFRKSDELTAERLAMLLKFFDQHGRYIVDNSEFSYIATSNHYLSDVVGLFWIGTLLPELEKAADWRVLGWREVLSEVDKQILPDGADFEASTGYHRFITEMIFHTFWLAERNGVEVPHRYKHVMARMLGYQSAITRPDGKMPMVGDCDGSRFLPMTRQAADASDFMLEMAGVERISESRAFPDAGIYIMRDRDLYLHFNASDCGLNGRGSHGHNDVLSIEVFANGQAWIVDPGSYAYNLDLDGRHEFRSTGYHSTVSVDGGEQNSISREMPFVIGNQAKPNMLAWESDHVRDRVAAEHRGFPFVKGSVRHERTVEFDKRERYWRIDDVVAAEGPHAFVTTFHLAPEIRCEISQDECVLLDGEMNGLVIRHGGGPRVRLETSSFSSDYGKKVATETLVFEDLVSGEHRASYLMIPFAAGGREPALELAARLADNK